MCILTKALSLFSGDFLKYESSKVHCTLLKRVIKCPRLNFGYLASKWTFDHKNKLELNRSGHFSSYIHQMTVLKNLLFSLKIIVFIVKTRFSERFLISPLSTREHSNEFNEKECLDYHLFGSPNFC